MSKIILGVDPDSKAHGAAIYINNKLTFLGCMPLMEFYNHIVVILENNDPDKLEFHIEDVCANKAMWHGKKESQAAKNMMSQRLGMCKQSQIELERLAEYFDIKVVKHKISKMWKKDKSQFERVTGWSGRSNEDTRSAAYFGWLGLN